MLILCPTLDYEIFFGENYFDVNKTLLEPTQDIINCFNKGNIKTSIFVDVLFLIRCKELNLNNILSPIEEQLIQFFKQGHELGLHIHPHWLDADYSKKNNKWNYSLFNFKLPDYRHIPSIKNNSINNIIIKGIQYLKNLVFKHDPLFEVRSFRAGGWSMQPEQEIINSLINNKILIDSTAFCGGYYSSDTVFYDFKRIPKNINWNISSDTGFSSQPYSKSINSLFEIPIGAIRYNLFRRISFKYLSLKEIKYQEPLKGKFHQIPSLSPKNKLLERINNWIFPQPWLFSLDHLTYQELKYHLLYYLKNNKNNSAALSLIIHPKEFNSRKLYYLKKFLRQSINIKDVQWTNLYEAFKYLNRI